MVLRATDMRSVDSYGRSCPMGLFSSVIHLRDVDQAKVLAALDECLRDHGFARQAIVPVPASGPQDLAQHDEWGSTQPYYLISKATGRWTAVIEAHFSVEGAPWLADLAGQMGEKLGTYSLALMVHDDDVLFYNLDQRGESLDGYNSCPQYFEQERISEEEVEQQRHTPEAFAPILPQAVQVDQLEQILDRGWWAAHDAGRLDEDGVEQEPSEGYVFEGERMIDLGRLLELNGPGADYPFAAWLGSSGIPWSEFLAVTYAPGL
jgi:hypothetical protein